MTKLTKDECMGSYPPEVSKCRITAVVFPVQYYQHFNYGPELMKFRTQSVQKLGWSSKSFDLPCSPYPAGSYSLLSKALDRVSQVLRDRQIWTERIYPSTVICELKRYRKRMNYCVLYFNHDAYEFYHLFFLLGDKNGCPFENVPNPKIDTWPQMHKWAVSFEAKKRRQYKACELKWKPYAKEE